ncbi:MAG: hypothetical protein FWG66_12475, partial [Spirochaetes bacterium]|nr:hypothetical protein [Spirochaetota bacterium]
RLSPQSVMQNVASVSACGSFAITAAGGLWRLPEAGEPFHVMDNAAYAAHLGGANFAITGDGTLWAWGRNLLPVQGQNAPPLGDGTTDNRDAPVRIMGDVASITVMGNTAYAITNDGGLWEWGYRASSEVFLEPQDEGQLWEFAFDNGSLAGISLFLEDERSAGLGLSPVRVLENAVSVAPTYFSLDHGWVNGFRTFALTSCGEVWAWGANDMLGRGLSLLGDGSSETRPLPVRIVFFE